MNRRICSLPDHPLLGDRDSSKAAAVRRDLMLGIWRSLRDVDRGSKRVLACAGMPRSPVPPPSTAFAT